MTRVGSPFRAVRAAALALLATVLLADAASAQIPIPLGPRGRPAPQGVPRPQADTIPGDSARDIPQDSIIDALLRLEGYVPVEYQGDSAEFNNRERTLRLRGRPVVTRLGQRLSARDSIIYRERTEFVEIYGEPEVTGEGQNIAGDVIYYDLANKRASVEGARTTVSEGATWYVQGDVTSEEEGERVFAEGSTFTSDDREQPAYHFRADRLKVLRNRVLVGRPAYLYFRNVPVFVLPFIVQDLAQGRRSGFLIPEFEINDIIRTDQRGRGTRGTGRQISNVGYYWAMNDYMGLHASVDWRSQSWTSLTVGYQFNWRRKFLGGAASFQHFWREDGTSWNLQGNGNWRPDERTTLGTSLNYTSAPNFERNRQVNPFRQLANITSTASLSRTFGWGDLTSGATLTQEIGTSDQSLRSQLSVSPKTISIFPTGDAEPRWYNDGSLTLSSDVTWNRDTPGDGLIRRQPTTEDTNGSLNSNLRIGPIGIGGGVRYTRQSAAALAAIDSSQAALGVDSTRLGLIPARGRRTIDWSAATGYEFRFVGATRLTPSLSVGQGLAQRDTSFAQTPADSMLLSSYNSFVAGPLRVNFGASLATELFGFFGGFGPYSAIRHHLTPRLDYSYSPRVEQDSLQNLVFGPAGGRENNQLRFSVNQTFEAKLREPRERSDTQEAIDRAGTGNPNDPEAGNAGAQTDTANAGREGETASQPAQAEKITLLSLTTSGFAYDFSPVDSARTHFLTETVDNTIRSDLLGGFTFSVSHDLFADELAPGGTRSLRRGRFSPYLTSLQTGFTFGANSPLFRRLGFGRATEGERRTERGQTPPEQGVPTLDPPGAQTSTNLPFPTSSGGSWSVQVNYSLRRQRPSPLDTLPGRTLQNNQQLSGGLTFFPSRHWAVNWYTDYSITQGKFGTHVLNFKRDLYRWQANFDFTRAPNGNTSFSFSVHLTDLPDLKADYRRDNLGGDRAGP